MLKFKVSLVKSEIAFLKSKGCIPFSKGGYEFGEDTEVIETDLVKFAANPKYPYKRISKELVLDPYLNYEVINEDSETTD